MVEIKNKKHTKLAGPGPAFMVLIFSAYLIIRRLLIKKFAFIIATVLLISIILMGLLTNKQNTYLSEHQAAIILNSSIYVKSSPDEDSSNVFMLHEGTKVDVLDQLNEWRKVRIANGNIGWTKNENLEII